MILQIDENLKLLLSHASHAEQLFAAVDANRTHLSVFLPWVPDMKSVADFSNYLQNCETLNAQGLEYSFNIFENNNLIGRVGLSFINKTNRSANIGYWLASDAQGKGIMTKAVKRIMEFGFEELKLNRLEIKAATGNKRSSAIPEKLGFTKEGTLRQAERVNEAFLDLILYSLLKEEYKK
ncbi:GNAT family N-acetyltransferase [Niabella ginsengisoli]|uniref:GNAT family N-acetyltransferase n=1 Tax=Niabella ginsengisoli TaxID=522298 RepID=A0ABS9SQL8_9BACT|nr:GNAT family protein [Niabella ginsengisoli]MCH5600672.1 GNAT family N-acetyltransferase [Niabella ginsengisoli]